MTAPPHAFFVELGAACYDRHGPDVWSNASALVRRRVLGPEARSRTPTHVARLRRLAALEALSATTFRRGRRFRPVTAEGGASVLLFAPFGRADYDALFLPVMRALAESGIRCRVLTTRDGVDRWRAHARTWEEQGHRTRERCAPLDVALLEAYAGLRVHRAAVRELRALRPAIADVAESFATDAHQRAALTEYFVAFAFQKALFSAALERLTPSVVLAVHFLTGRGYRAAIGKGLPDGRRPPTVLMQHGGFTREETRGFHDFEGADLLLLWGERWRQELERFAALPFSPTPRAVVVGNPKYERTALAPAPAAGTHQRPTGGRLPDDTGQQVLYMSTFLRGGGTDPVPLAQAIAATRGEAALALRVKRHPLERPDHVRSLLGSGALRAGSEIDAAKPALEAIRGADVVIGPPSTTLFEAAYAGKPVVLLGDAPPAAYREFLHAGDAEGLRAILARLRGDEAWRRGVVAAQDGVVEHVFGPHGSATDRAAGAVRSLMERPDHGGAGP